MQAPSITGAYSAGLRKATSDMDYQRRLALNYREAFKAVSEEMLQLGRYIEKQMAAGAPVSPSWLSRQERYLSLQTQLAAAVQKYGGATADLLDVQRGVAARAGLDGVAATLDGFQSNWAMLDQRAFDAAMAALELNRSPLRQLIDGMPGQALSQFKDVWAGGLAAGHNPLKIARALNHTIQGMTQGRAQLMARTEWHRATRESRAQLFEKSDVVKAWIWRCALDGKSCGICYLNHGTEHKTDERLPGHPGCRCTMIPKTVEWSDLGLPGVPRTQPKFEPGSSMFRRLSEKEQRRLIGKRRVEMFKAGTPLKSMTYTAPNAIWGPVKKFVNLPPAGAPSAGGKRGSPPNEDLYANPKTFAGETNSYNPIVHNAMEAYGATWGNLPTYTTAEKQALSAYQGSSYRQINTDLRTGMWETEGFYGTIKQLDSAMLRATSTPEALLVRRGTNFSGINMDSYSNRGEASTLAEMKTKIGTTIVEPGFLSTAMTGGFNRPVLYEITVPKGARGVVMTGKNTDASNTLRDQYATSNGEGEVLFPRDSRLLIQSVTQVGVGGMAKYKVKARLIV